jgi:hypothetical protein
MAVMLRQAGIPSRVVLGYTHDVPDSKGSFTVTTSDAHAWVEAYFAGLGWVPFDPTPISGQPGAATGSLPWAPHANAGSNNSNDLPNKASLSNPAAQTSSAPSSTHRPTTRHARPQSSFSWTVPLIVLAALAALAIVLLLPFLTRRIQRARRLRQAVAGDGEALWQELAATATDLGYVWSPAHTPRQVADDLSGPTGAAEGSLRTLTAVVERARYAPEGPGDTATVDAEFARVEAALRGRLPVGTRLRAALLPASVIRRASGRRARRSARRH